MAKELNTVYVYQGDVLVGTMPLLEYRDLVDRVSLRPDLKILYCLRFIWKVQTKAAKFVLLVPTIAFLALYMVLLFNPAAFTEFVANMKAASPESITTALRDLATLLICSAVLVLPLQALMSPESWRINRPADDVIAKELRARFKINEGGQLRAEVMEQNPSGSITFHSDERGAA